MAAAKLQALTMVFGNSLGPSVDGARLEKRRGAPVAPHDLIRDLDITVIHTTTGEILRELTLNPDRRYQPRTRGNP